MVKYVTGEELKELLANSNKTVFCDFFATWCAPCRMLAPVIEELSDEYEGKAIFVKMDVDEDANEDAAREHGISSIPNLLAFKNGAQVASSVGFIPKESLKTFIEENL